MGMRVIGVSLIVFKIDSQAEFGKKKLGRVLLGN
jgi:hypothetical protein